MAKPTHIAIIMDGNGRWAKARGLPRAAGHRAGVEALRETVRAAGDMRIPWLTVYAFSSENWTRPKAEVSDLMGLLKLFIRRDLAELHKNGVRVLVIGDRENLAPDIKALLDEAESLTKANTSMSLVIAFIAKFESHVAGQLALNDHVPLVDERVPEIGLNAAEGNRRRQREDIQRIPASQATREVVAASKSGIQTM